MAEITDINELAPDLLKKSTAQLEREITERQMALNELKRREEEKIRGIVLDEAGTRIDRLIDDLKWLQEHNFLSEGVKEMFMANARGKGSKEVPGERLFLPHLRFRKPTK